jgi:hypothetical protein
MNLSRSMHVGFTCLLLLSGCTWKPWGSDEGRTNDAGVTEKEVCTNKVSACRNTCYEADRGRACQACCTENGEACDEDRGYSFYSCADKE